MTKRQMERPGELIRALIRGQSEPSKESLGRILAHVAAAGFSTRVVEVHPDLQGKEYLGHQFGRYAPSDWAHLGKRVLVEEQWKHGTTQEEYLTDIKSAALHKAARAVVYLSRGVSRVGVLSPNEIPQERLGPNAKPWLWVVYDADRGIITSGYQVSGMEKVWLPEKARWL